MRMISQTNLTAACCMNTSLGLKRLNRNCLCKSRTYLVMAGLSPFLKSMCSWFLNQRTLCSSLMDKCSPARDRWNMSSRSEKTDRPTQTLAFNSRAACSICSCAFRWAEGGVRRSGCSVQRLVRRRGESTGLESIHCYIAAISARR